MPRRSRPARPRDAQADPPVPRAEASPYASVDAELRSLARSIGLLGAVTPRDAHLERARLISDFTRGRDRLPVWRYDVTSATHSHRLRVLDALGPALRALEREPLGRLYRERAEELRLELEAALAVGTPSFGERAAARFAPGPRHAAADALAERWSAEVDVPRDRDTVHSDDRDPRSLVSRLRAEVAQRALPFAVRTSPALSALAAISGDTVWVAEGRLLDAADVERTVVHEIDAHAVPRARARKLTLGLFALGTAGGTDDQEGYALWLEEKRGVSGPGRHRELAARHRAVRLMREGADFVAVVRALTRGGIAVDAAIRIAERAFRGSNGASPGLGREQVYLEAFVRVQEHLDARPGDEPVLAAGQVAVRAIDALAPWAVVRA